MGCGRDDEGGLLQGMGKEGIDRGRALAEEKGGREGGEQRERINEIS